MRWFRAIREVNGSLGDGAGVGSFAVRAEPGWQELLGGILAGAGHHAAADGRFSLAAAKAPDLPPESYRMRFMPADGGGTIALSASDDRGLGYAAQVAAELMSFPPRAEVTLADGPGFTRRGIVEGFYGRPWRWADRLAMLAFMADWRLNTYIYAPKNDPLHRELWRVPYGRKAMAHFHALAAEASRHRVDFGVAVSPGLSLTYSDEGDYRLLLAKFRQFTGLGLTIFGLYLDDIPFDLVHGEDRSRFATLAGAQVALANRLYADLAREAPGVALIVCPTEYHGHGDSDYLREMGTGLRPEIGLHWTGRGVWSTAITREEAEAVGSVLQRLPLYWDNYQANDYIMAHEIHLAPYRGRASDLCNAAGGILANPMRQPLASRIPLATMALYLWRPERYQANQAGDVALRAFVPEKAHPALVQFAQANAPRALSPTGPKAPRASLRQARRQMAREDFDGARRTLAAEVHRMQGSAALLQEYLPRPLREEIRPWLAEYGAWASLAARGLRVEEGLLRLTGAKKGLPRFGAYLRLEGDLVALRHGLRQSLGWHTGVCGGALREWLVDLWQRVDAFIAGESMRARLLRPLVKLLGLALIPWRASGSEPPPP